jgi:hypothetical protein
MYRLINIVTIFCNVFRVEAITSEVHRKTQVASTTARKINHVLSKSRTASVTLRDYLSQEYP